RTLRCDAFSCALVGLRGTDHQRHTLFLEDLVEAAQYVLPLSGRNLVSFEGPTHVVAGDLPLSLSPLNERHDRDGLGNPRGERTGGAGRHEQPLGTLENGFRPRPPWPGADHRPGDWADGAGGGREEEQRRERRPYSLRGCHLLGHRVLPVSVTPNPRVPSHT